MYQPTKLFNLKHHVTPEMRNPTLQSLRLSNEVSFSEVFAWLHFLNQQCLKIFSACFVSSSLFHAFLPIMWTLLSFYLYLKHLILFNSGRLRSCAILCCLNTDILWDVNTLLLLSKEYWRVEVYLPGTGRASFWAQAFLFVSNSIYLLLLTTDL